MAIGNIGGGGVNQTGGFQQTRENRQVQTEQRIKEATLSTTGQLSTTQIQEHQNFYNKSLGDIDGLRNGDLKSIKNLRPNDLERLFPRRTDDERIKDATDPHIFDNQGAKDVRKRITAPPPTSQTRAGSRRARGRPYGCR